MTSSTVAIASRLADHGQHRLAFRLLLAAARRGDKRVFLNLGYAYDVGEGVRKSKRKAMHWYRRAVAAGEGSAAHNIGTIYRDWGDALRAARWFRRAIVLGNSGSNLELGQLCLGALCQPAEALACFRAVGSEQSDSVVEAARAWAVLAEGLLA